MVNSLSHPPFPFKPNSSLSFNDFQIFLASIFPEFLNQFLSLLFFLSYHFLYFILGIMFSSEVMFGNEVLFFIFKIALKPQAIILTLVSTLVTLACFSDVEGYAIR